MRAMRRLLYAGFIVVAALFSALLAEANRWGAPTRPCNDMFPIMPQVLGACAAPSSPLWVVTLTAACGALVAGALPLLVVRLGRTRPTPR